ncbi:MAG TPA: hypothetical protein VJV79_09025 [Polyangiaceae bacterium]|nr:hypothetical protein [Polyangiaceae bacterium]
MTTLLDSWSRPAYPLALNDSRAYFLANAQPNDSDVQSIDLNGMNPLTHGKSLLGASLNLLLDANSVYWSSYWSSGGTEIDQAPLLGTTQTPRGEDSGRLIASGATLYLGGAKAVFSLPPGAERPQNVLMTQGKLSGMADASGIFVRAQALERWQRQLQRPALE